MAKGVTMNTIGELLSRDLDRKIEEIIQVDQDDEQSVHAEITEYIATDSIRYQYTQLLKAIAEAPSEQHESIGVWISGFFGSGKSSFAKHLGYALQNRKVLGEDFAQLFKQQMGDTQISNFLDSITTRIPTEAILFEVAKAMYSMRKSRNTLPPTAFETNMPSFSRRLPKPPRNSMKALACGFRASSAPGKVRLPSISTMRCRTARC